MNLEDAALLTHRGCMDGSTCSLVFCAAGGKKENIFYSSPNHEEVDEKFADLTDNWEGPIIVADLSVSVAMAETVINYDNIVLLDHHKSAIPLANYPWCHIEKNNDRAGGLMLYDFLKDRVGSPSKLSQYKDLVVLADDYDRWIKDHYESDILSSLHNVLGQEEFVNRFSKNPSIRLSKSETYVLHLETKKMNSYIENAKKDLYIIEKVVKDRKVRVAFLLANNYQSMLGNNICSDPLLDVDAAIMIGNRSISMRAKKGCPIDLSEVAKRHSGGGHQLAAGCSLSGVLGKDLVETIAEKIKI